MIKFTEEETKVIATFNEFYGDAPTYEVARDETIHSYRGELTAEEVTVICDRARAIWLDMD
jgi:hypothetical protein